MLFQPPFEHPAGLYVSTSGEYWTYALREGGDGRDELHRAVHSSVSSPLASRDFELVLRLRDVPGADSEYLNSEGAGIVHPRVISIEAR